MCGNSAEAPSGAQGVLNTIAAKVVMKVFYGARVARPDLLRAIGHLSCYLTKWTPECDRRLHKLMCYVKSTVDYVYVGWVGDPVEKIRLHLFSDADFAGCQTTNKSTTGVYMALEEPNTCFPISTVSKKQGCVSYSTPEAELVAGAFALRQCGYPGIVIWERLSGQSGERTEKQNDIAPRGGASGTAAAASVSKPTTSQNMDDPDAKPEINIDVVLPECLYFHGDNSAMVAICHSGRNPTMRHLSRHHGISLTMIHDEVISGRVCLGYISTHDMKADIFTKFYADRKRDVWSSVRDLINVTHPSKVGEMWGKPE